MEIDNILLVCECIKKIDGNKIINIDNTIKSLKDFKTTKGDIKEKRLHSLLFHYYDRYKFCDHKGDVIPFKIPLRSMTSGVVNKVEDYIYDTYSKQSHYYFPKDNHPITLCGYIEENDDNIYKLLFDVDSYTVSHDLEAELYRNGFEFNKAFSKCETLRCWHFCKALE